MALRDDRPDVERLFATLVEVLAERDGPQGLRRPIHVAEIYQQLVPYRTYRDRLHIDASEDYEMAILRLLAGEGGFAAMQPDEARQMLADEAASPSPDPTLIREYAAADVLLDPARVRALLTRDSGFSQTPDDTPGADAEPERETDAAAAPEAARPRLTQAPVFALEADAPAQPRAPDPPVAGGACKSCGRTLPLHRPVVFCPFCGQRAGVRACTSCGEELESGWRFCVVCGETAAR